MNVMPLIFLQNHTNTPNIKSLGTTIEEIESGRQTENIYFEH